MLRCLRVDQREASLEQRDEPEREVLTHVTASLVFAKREVYFRSIIFLKEFEVEVLFREGSFVLQQLHSVEIYVDILIHEDHIGVDLLRVDSNPVQSTYAHSYLPCPPAAHDFPHCPQSDCVVGIDCVGKRKLGGVDAILQRQSSRLEDFAELLP